MAITTNIWTSNQKKGYMAITVHYIDESWLLHHDIVRLDMLFVQVLNFYFILLSFNDVTYINNMFLYII